jgi:hypothetical protein
MSAGFDDRQPARGDGRAKRRKRKRTPAGQRECRVVYGRSHRYASQAKERSMTDNNSKVDPFASLGDMSDFRPKSPKQLILPQKQQIDSLSNDYGFTTRNFGPNTETKQYLRPNFRTLNLNSFDNQWLVSHFEF